MSPTMSDDQQPCIHKLSSCERCDYEERVYMLELALAAVTEERDNLRNDLHKVSVLDKKTIKRRTKQRDDALAEIERMREQLSAQLDLLRLATSALTRSFDESARHAVHRRITTFLDKHRLGEQP